MPSVVRWLDHSAEQQQRITEMLAMLGDRGTVDDLGIGTIRDAFSDLLFPGSSVIQTRARYFLFVPWIYQHVEHRGGADIVTKGANAERRLIFQLLEGDDDRGLIGKQALANLKTLPSAIYWSGLQRYGIFRAPLTLRQYARAVSRGLPPPRESDELVERRASYWRDLPDAPPGFFDKTSAAQLRLDRQDSEWLRDRVLSADTPERPSLYGAWMKHVSAGFAPPTSLWPWDELPPTTPQLVRDIAWHAERFSSIVWAANNLYNLMLVDERVAKGMHTDALGDQPETYEANLALWAEEAGTLQLQAWAEDLDEMWSTIAGRPVDRDARIFVKDFAAAVAATSLNDLGRSRLARDLVRNREQQKKAQPRFGNDRRLREFRGFAGTTPLSFRWSVARDLITDIADGLGRRPPSEGSC